MTLFDLLFTIVIVTSIYYFSNFIITKKIRKFSDFMLKASFINVVQAIIIAFVIIVILIELIILANTIKLW